MHEITLNSDKADKSD